LLLAALSCVEEGGIDARIRYDDFVTGNAELTFEVVCRTF
jgi:hypothetical protein